MIYLHREVVPLQDPPRVVVAAAQAARQADTVLTLHTEDDVVVIVVELTPEERCRVNGGDIVAVLKVDHGEAYACVDACMRMEG